MKKLVGLVLSAFIAASSAFGTINSSALHSSAETSDSFNPNYVEALQKSLYFYEAQQAGPLPEWNRVEWRGDATMNDIVTGGWYDAGDHVKFNLPMSYSAAMLAWGLYEYGDGIEDSGQREIMEQNVEFVLDYLVKCDLGDKVIYQIGNGTDDHNWWGPVELIEYMMDRPYYTGNGTCVVAGMSAALAAGAAALDGRSSKTDEYLEHAISLFELADTVRSDEEYTAANNFYTSFSGFWDELFWAANWLYIATGDQTYLDKAATYIPNLSKEMVTKELKYSWAQCWDDVMQGAMVLYARSTKDPTYIKQVQKHLDYMTVGYDGNTVAKLPGGLVYLDTWGCLRYATNIGFIAAVYSDTVIDDPVLIARYKELYETQINYCLGKNPDNRSYVVGYGNNYPVNPHHRTAHGSWGNSIQEPEQNRHLLYGALVGGPTQDGTYEDNRENFINNEVATDYNAGYTALLCKMVSEYGGTALEDFPPKEVKTEPEFFVEASVGTTTTQSTVVKMNLANHSAWPARVVNNLSFNYYMDLSEVFAAGKSLSDVSVIADYDESGVAIISPLTQYKDTDIYYVNICIPDGEKVMPVSAKLQETEVQLRIILPYDANCWDAENDYSNQGIIGVTDSVRTEYITVYDNGKLVFGTEPDGTQPVDDTTVISELKGDVNCDNTVNASDVKLMKEFLLKGKSLSSQGAKNAQMNSDGKLNAIDLAMIKRKLML